MSSRILPGLAFGAALLAVAPALAETVRTKDGQRLVGTIVEETQGELVLRTKYGVLVIPAANIDGVDGRPGDGRPGELAKPTAAAPAVAEAPAPDLTKLRALRMKARRQAQTGSSADAALASYAELLALDPDDAEAHLEVAALRARRGEGQEAVAALRKALLAGLVDAERLRGPDFAGLETGPPEVKAAHQRLLADRVGLLRIAARRVPARLARDLRARGARASYTAVADDGRRLSWLHALEPKAFAAVRAEVDALVTALRGNLFTGDTEGPLHLVLVAEQDEAAVQIAGASYDRSAHVLTLAPLPFGSLWRAPTAQRELVRALLVADERARRQRHPAWLVEGLVELFGTCGHEGAGLLPRQSALVATITTATTTPWGGALTRDPRERGARLAARSVAHYALVRGALGRLYEGLAAVSTATAPDAGAALAAAFDQPQDAAEAGWRAWLAEQRPPVVPFTGLVTTATARGLRVSYVQPESGAARANLGEGDVVTAVDGVAVRSEDDLSEVLGARKAGDEVLVELAREDRTARVRLVLGTRPPGPIGPMRARAPYLGAAVAQAEGGVSITSVDAGSPAAKAGLQAGDVVRSLDGEVTGTVRAWLRALRVKEVGQAVKLTVERAGAQRTVEVELAKPAE